MIAPTLLETLAPLVASMIDEVGTTTKAAGTNPAATHLTEDAMEETTADATPILQEDRLSVTRLPEPIATTAETTLHPAIAATRGPPTTATTAVATEETEVSSVIERKYLRAEEPKFL